MHSLLEKRLVLPPVKECRILSKISNLESSRLVEMELLQAQKQPRKRKANLNRLELNLRNSIRKELHPEKVV